MKTIKQKIKYDNEAIIQQSQIYTDEYRALFFEYVDNSIDSAEDFYNPDTGEYSNDIIIKITKTGGKKSDRNISIIDNCSGMKINLHEDFTVFRSSKRNDPRQNGTNGMGLFAGLSMCNNLQIETKRRTGDYYRFSITPNIFKKSTKEAPEIEISVEKPSRNDLSSGTTITLSAFKDSVFEDIDFGQLKKEIEKHFEPILSRKKIKIVLQENNEGEVICESFPYADYCDKPYSKILTTLYRRNSKKYKTEKTYDIIANPVRIFLIAAKNRNLNREPFIALNGRRITEVSKVEQFRTNKKLPIWGRGNVAGILECTGVLETNPTRKDIKKTELSKAFFYTLSKLEPEILEYIESQTAVASSERFQEIEEKVNEILRDYSAKTENSVGVHKFKEYTINGYRIRENKSTGSETPLQSDTPKRPSKANPVRTPRERNKKVIVRYPSQHGQRTEVSDTFRFKIDDINEPFKNEKGQSLRSIINGNTIILFQKHEEFRKRVFQSAKGYYEFTPRSIHYIAIEILTHVKEVETRNKDEPLENLYRDFATEVYKLEEKLNKLNGEKI